MWLSCQQGCWEYFRRRTCVKFSGSHLPGCLKLQWKTLVPCGQMERETNIFYIHYTAMSHRKPETQPKWMWPFFIRQTSEGFFPALSYRKDHEYFISEEKVASLCPLRKFLSPHVGFNHSKENLIMRISISNRLPHLSFLYLRFWISKTDFHNIMPKKIDECFLCKSIEEIYVSLNITRTQSRYKTHYTKCHTRKLRFEYKDYEYVLVSAL